MPAPVAQPAAHADTSTSQAPIAPGMDADVKELSPKMTGLLADLKRVDELTLIEGLDGSELSLCESSERSLRREAGHG
jgi:hypothetical protein